MRSGTKEPFHWHRTVSAAKQDQALVFVLIPSLHRQDCKPLSFFPMSRKLLVVLPVN